MLAQAFHGLLEAFTSGGGHAARTPAEHVEVARHMVTLFWAGSAAEEHRNEVLSS